MANESNLKPFKKGQSGNPSGRPKGSLNRSTIARKWLDTHNDSINPITQVTEQLTQEDLMTLALIKKANKGDVQAYKQLMDSAYGKATASVDINSSEGISVDFKELMRGIKTS